MGLPARPLSYHADKLTDDGRQRVSTSSSTSWRVRAAAQNHGQRIGKNRYTGFAPRTTSQKNARRIRKKLSTSPTRAKLFAV
jgi:hypothetical protein